jgi:hypothetical protein
VDLNPLNKAIIDELGYLNAFNMWAILSVWLEVSFLCGNSSPHQGSMVMAGVITTWLGKSPSH